MATTEVNSIEFVVTDCSFILEDQIVEADTIVDLEFLSDVPVVLHVESNLVEYNL